MGTTRSRSRSHVHVSCRIWAGVAWHPTNDAVLAQEHRRLLNDPARFDRVRGIGGDEHVWRCTRWGDKYVTVMIHLHPVADAKGTATLLDMVPGRWKQVFRTWPVERPPHGVRVSRRS